MISLIKFLMKFYQSNKPRIQVIAYLQKMMGKNIVYKLILGKCSKNKIIKSTWA